MGSYMLLEVDLQLRAFQMTPVPIPGVSENYSALRVQVACGVLLQAAQPYATLAYGVLVLAVWLSVPQFQPGQGWRWLQEVPKESSFMVSLSPRTVYLPGMHHTRCRVAVWTV